MALQDRLLSLAGPRVATWFLLNHPKVAAGLAISGVFELAPLRDSPHVNDKVKLTEAEIQTLSSMRLPGVNKPLSITYGTSELPAMIASSETSTLIGLNRISPVN